MVHKNELEKLEQRYRDNPTQWFAALADSYRKAGELELALEVVRSGIVDRPDYPSAQIVLGRVLLDLDENAEAAQAFQRVLELDPENIIALKTLGEIAEREGDAITARWWLRRLLEVDPMNEAAAEALVRLEVVEVEDDGEGAATSESAVSLDDALVRPEEFETAATIDPLARAFSTQPEPEAAEPPEAVEPPEAPEAEFEPVRESDVADAVDPFEGAFSKEGEPEAAEATEAPEGGFEGEQEPVVADAADPLEGGFSRPADPEVVEPLDVAPWWSDDLDATADDAPPTELPHATSAEPAAEIPGEGEGDADLAAAVVEPDESVPDDSRVSELDVAAGDVEPPDVEQEPVPELDAPAAAQFRADDSTEVAPVAEVHGTEAPEVESSAHGAALSEELLIEHDAELDRLVIHSEAADEQPLIGEPTEPSLGDLLVEHEAVQMLPEHGERDPGELQLEVDAVVSEFSLSDDVDVVEQDAVASGSSLSDDVDVVEQDAVASGSSLSDDVDVVEQDAVASGSSLSDDVDVVEHDADALAAPHQGEEERRSPEVDQPMESDWAPAGLAEADRPEQPVLEVEPTGPPAGEPGLLEPVVTSTMAEVFARQGLHREAREIYEQLLRRNPNDADLQRKFAALGEAGDRAAPDAVAVSRFSVTHTGGTSARTALQRIFAARLGEVGAGESGASSVRGARTGGEPEEHDRTGRW